ncbi:MAG: hypothetical protein U5K69_01540 [Balneolaceae bacterium]|nr:hypothetical protein [Balneolaceae bacterium]
MLTTALWLGMAMYLVRPVQADAASNSFASWLDSVVKLDEHNSEGLQKKLYQLKESEQSLNKLIQKASEIISRHNEDFNLPLGAAETNTQSVYNMLVWEWNSFQTGNGMGKASVPTTIKASFYPQVDKFSTSLDGELAQKQDQKTFLSNQFVSVESLSFSSFHISPSPAV